MWMIVLCEGEIHGFWFCSRAREGSKENNIVEKKGSLLLVGMCAIVIRVGEAKRADRTCETLLWCFPCGSNDGRGGLSDRF